MISSRMRWEREFSPRSLNLTTEVLKSSKRCKQEAGWHGYEKPHPDNGGKQLETSKKKSNDFETIDFLKI